MNELPLARRKPDALESLFGQKDMMPMWVADSEFQVAEPIQQALIDRIRQSGFPYEYKPESLFLAQKNWYQQQYGVHLSREEVLYSPSIPTSLTLIFDVLTQAGDGIIIQGPVWPNFRQLIRDAGRKVVSNSLVLEAGHYRMDVEDLKTKAADPENKVLIICNPHNPVGRVWTKEELFQIMEICKQYNIYLIADEIHKDIMLFGNSFTSFLSLKPRLDKLIVLTSEAKSFNLPGILDSLLIIPHAGLREKIHGPLKKYHLGRTNALATVALLAAYTHCEHWLKAFIAQIERNVRAIEALLEKVNSQIKLIKPEGTFQVWLDFRDVFNDSKAMHSIVSEKSGVAMNAGHWFGREGALFMRMNIATTEAKVTSAMTRVIDSCA